MGGSCLAPIQNGPHCWKALRELVGMAVNGSVAGLGWGRRALSLPWCPQPVLNLADCWYWVWLCAPPFLMPQICTYNNYFGVEQFNSFLKDKYLFAPSSSCPTGVKCTTRSLAFHHPMPKPTMYFTTLFSSFIKKILCLPCCAEQIKCDCSSTHSPGARVFAGLKGIHS